MNERIQQLAEQAGMYVDLNGNPWPKWMSAEECELAYAKFAELIVAECALLCISRPSPGDDVRSREHCAEQIREHFGVEDVGS